MQLQRPLTVDCSEEVELDKAINLKAPGETGDGGQENSSEVEHGKERSNQLSTVMQVDSRMPGS